MIHAGPQVRTWHGSDYDAAFALWKATPGVGLSAADEREPIFRFLERNPGMSFIAESGGRLVGTILCGHDGRRGLIHHLVVAEEHRRRGLAMQLLHAGLQALCSAGIDKCHVLVFRDNEPGAAFWRAARASLREELALFSIVTSHDA
jgi:ribosomal protein S18 acetylase RimI-like enzyme